MEVTGVIATDAGLFGVWAPDAFEHIADYETWEAELLADEDILRHVKAGSLVPINIGADGAYQVAARAGTTALSDRESRYRTATSGPYLLVTDGDVIISGIETVGNDVVEDGVVVPVPAGRWSVTISLIDWAAEPGQEDEEGRPLPTALPDFVVLLNPATGTDEHRTSLETFDL